MFYVYIKQSCRPGQYKRVATCNQKRLADDIGAAAIRQGHTVLVTSTDHGPYILRATTKGV